MNRSAAYGVAPWRCAQPNDAVSQPRPAAADPKGVIVVPAVPANLEVPVGNQVYLKVTRSGRGLASPAVPKRDHPAAMCPPPASPGIPRAADALFDIDVGHDKQIITHFLSPNPGRGRHTASHVAALPGYKHGVGQQHLCPPARSSTDQAFVAAGAIPWLLLPVAGTQVGPTGGMTR